MSSEALERAQVVRAALMVDGYGSPPRHTVMGQEALAAACPECGEPLQLGHDCLAGSASAAADEPGETP